MPSLCSIETQVRSLRAPRLPSAATRNFGATNSEIPRVPAGRVGQSREHEMDDVLGDVVFAPGDEDLRAEQAVLLAIRLGARAHGGKIRAGLRFRQVHRSGPLARHHLWQEARLELI